MERAHRGLRPGVHHAGCGIRGVDVDGRDELGRAGVRATHGWWTVTGVRRERAGVRHAGPNLRLAAAGLGPHAPWLRPGCARPLLDERCAVRLRDFGKTLVRCTVDESGCGSLPSTRGRGPAGGYLESDSLVRN